MWLETGLSDSKTRLPDFHRMTVSVMKIHFRKLLPKIICYSDFKKLNNSDFLSELQSITSYYNNRNLETNPDWQRLGQRK